VSRNTSLIFALILPIVPSSNALIVGNLKHLPLVTRSTHRAEKMLSSHEPKAHVTLFLYTVRKWFQRCRGIHFLQILQ